MARELVALGDQPRVDEGGVAWEGDARSLMRANLWLRTASRVLVRVASFRATAFHELERAADRVDWARFTGGASRPPAFRVTARKSKLYHTDAIAERLTRSAGGGGLTPARSTGKRSRTPDIETGDDADETGDGATQLFIVRVVRDVFEISADASGALLHQRGYRLQAGKAPLRETLAAALLLAAGWSGDQALVDPFCGSGTITIEGALLARRIAPGLRRGFAFQHWPRFDHGGWQQLLADARANEHPSAPAPIVGSDRDAGAIEASRANAVRAGVDADVVFDQRAVSDILPPASHGLVATNPPYGKRVSEGRDMRNLFARLGDVLRTGFEGWQLAMYAPDSRVPGQTRIALNPAIRTVNGGISVAGWLGRVQALPPIPDPRRRRTT